MKQEINIGVIFFTKDLIYLSGKILKLNDSKPIE